MQRHARTRWHTDDMSSIFYIIYMITIHFHSATRSPKLTLQNIRDLKGNLGFWVHCWYIEVMELFYTYYINSQRQKKMHPHLTNLILLLQKKQPNSLKMLSLSVFWLLTRFHAWSRGIMRVWEVLVDLKEKCGSAILWLKKSVIIKQSTISFTLGISVYHGGFLGVICSYVWVFGCIETGNSLWHDFVWGMFGEIIQDHILMFANSRVGVQI